MAVKLLSDSHDATITDVDQLRIDVILTFWFMDKDLSAPQIDGRMDMWFGEDAVFDQQIVNEFAMSSLLPQVTSSTGRIRDGDGWR